MNPTFASIQAISGSNDFAIIDAATKSCLADITALASRLNRALNGPYTTTASIETAIYQADQLADAALSLAKMLDRVGA